MSIYERNLKVLIVQNPVLATQLFSVEGNSRFEVFQDPSDPLNVNLFDHLHGSALYAGVPQHEIIEKVDTFEKEFSRYPVVFIYGVANGLFLKLLLQNPNHTHLIVIEPEIEMLYIVLNLIDFSVEMEEGRVYFFLDNQIHFSKAVEIFSDSAIKVFCKTYHLEPNIGYYETFYHDVMMECNANLIRGIEHVVTGLGNDTTDALIGLEWHLANVQKMVQTPTLLDLIQKIKTTNTAIIISTGPSLVKQLPLLKTIKDHATLLSADASLPILERHGIKPDVVFSIERVADTAEFYRRTSREFQEGIICAMSSLSHPLLVESVNGATLQMNMRPFGYTRYFNLPEYGYIGIGMSAANMAYEAAFHGKFETIILIGQDLAYGEDGKSHSEGHVFGSLKEQKGDFEIEAYGGNGTVRTSKIWNMFRNFFENDIYEAQKHGVMTVNATEGGARIHGAVEMCFGDAIEKYVDTACTKEPIVLTPPDSETVAAKMAEVDKKIEKMENYVETMQKKVSALFEKVSETIENLDRIQARKNLQKVDYDVLAGLMGEIDEIKIKFDDPEFVDIFIDATQALIVHHELEIARIQVRAIENDDDRRLKMVDWIYTHQHWLFALAGIMEAELIAIRRRGSQSRYVHQAELGEEGISLSGYFYDYTYQDKQFELELLVDHAVVMTKKLEIAHNAKGKFSFSIPACFFNDQVHSFMVREKQTGIILSGTPDTRIFFSADRTKAEFMESLHYIDTETIKNLYCPNTIGFIASEKNMNDVGFINYIKQLIIRFPDIEFKAICFADMQSDFFDLGISKLTKIYPKNIEMLLNEIEVFISNKNDYDSYLNLIEMMGINNRILRLFYNDTLYKSTQKIIDYKSDNDVYNFKDEKYNYQKLNLCDIWNNPAMLFCHALLILSNISVNSLNQNDRVVEWTFFKIIELSMNNQNVKNFINKKF